MLSIMPSSKTSDSDNTTVGNGAVDARSGAYGCIQCSLDWSFIEIRHTGRCGVCGGGLVRLDTELPPTSTEISGLAGQPHRVQATEPSHQSVETPDRSSTRTRNRMFGRSERRFASLALTVAPLAL